MKKIFTLIFILVNFLNSFAQLSPPKTEGLFGGTILDITGSSLGTDSIKIFVSTESPNSVFYARVKTTPLSLVADSFRVLPSLSASKGFGSNIQTLAADKVNDFLFFGHDKGLYYTSESSSNATRIDSVSTQSLLLKDSILFYMQNGNLNFKRIRLNSIIHSGLSGYSISLPGLNYVISVHPISNIVYVLVQNDNTPILYKSNVPYYNLTASSNFTNIGISGTWPGVRWEGFGIAPEGRFYIGGADNVGKKIIYSDNETTWNFINTNIAGRAVSKISFAGDSSNYYVYFGTAVSPNKGLSWRRLGNMFYETHPNDGKVYVSSTVANCIFLPTDAGLGASFNWGDSIFDINNGIEALQINGLDMNVSKTGAWIASKAGLRKNTSYQSLSKKWSRAMFPNGDGSPYYAVSLVNNDTNRVYAGNNRVYKTNDAGLSWNMVFTPEAPPFNFPSFNVRVSKIAIASFDSNFIMVSYKADLPTKGGLFYSLNAGNNWSQLRIASMNVGQDLNINDISILKEGADTVAYIALDNDPGSPLFKSVFRLVKKGLGFTVNQDMMGVNTLDGISMSSQITDLELNSFADTLYAAGVDYSSSVPVYQVFMKLLAADKKWRRLNMNGFPSFTQSHLKVALGKDTLYASANEDLMVFPLRDSVWFRAYKYPVGSNINFLFYDDLLAGTSVGLYGHLGSETSCRPFIRNFNPSICENEFLSLPDSSKVNTNGQYQFLYKNKNGCDSIVTITLTINKPDVSISVKKDTLISNDSLATQYQWLDCNLGYQMINGATDKVFTPSKTGNYAVVVQRINCIDTSECVLIQANGKAEYALKSLRVYPNPSNGFIEIEGLEPNIYYLELIDLLGKVWLNQKLNSDQRIRVELQEIPSGIYILRLLSEAQASHLPFQMKLFHLVQP